MKKIIAIACFAITTISYAEDNCARPQNTFDSLYCARKIYFSLDDDLNKSYKELRVKLDDAGDKLLKTSQLTWIKERNTNCVNGNAVLVSCAVEITRERLYFLKDRLHECNSVGCINEKL